MSDNDEAGTSFEKLEQQFGETVAAHGCLESTEPSTDDASKTPAVDGIQCLKRLSQLLEMLCAESRENLGLRKRCSYLENGIRDLQSAPGSKEVDRKYSYELANDSTARLQEDGTSLDGHPLSLDFALKSHDGLQSLDSSMTAGHDSRGSKANNLIGKVKAAITRGGAGGGSPGLDGSHPFKKLSEEQLHQQKKKSTSKAPSDLDVFSDPDDTAGFQQREVQYSETALLQGSADDYGGVYLGPDDGAGDQEASASSSSMASTNPSKDSLVERGPPSGSPGGPDKVRSKRRFDSESSKPHYQSSIDETDDKEKAKGPWPFVKELLNSSSSSNPQNSSEPIATRSPVSGRKPKRSSTIGLGESKKHRKALKEAMDEGTTGEDFMEAFDKKMSKDFRKKMETWKVQPVVPRGKDDDKMASVTSLPTSHPSEGRGHPPLLHTLSASTPSSLIKNAKGSRPNRFKDRVKREWEKRRSKSKDRHLMEEGSSANRSKSCERPHVNPNSALSQDFTDKLREWSVKKGKDPDYYTADPEIRPRSGSMHSPTSKGAKAQDPMAMKAKRSSGLLSPDSAANWSIAPVTTGNSGRQSRSRARTTGGSIFRTEEKSKADDVRSPALNGPAGYSSDESATAVDPPPGPPAKHDPMTTPSVQVPTPPSGCSANESMPSAEHESMPSAAHGLSQSAPSTTGADGFLSQSAPAISTVVAVDAAPLLLNSPPPLITLDNQFLDSSVGGSLSSIGQRSLEDLLTSEDDDGGSSVSGVEISDEECQGEPAEIIRPRVRLRTSPSKPLTVTIPSNSEETARPQSVSSPPLDVSISEVTATEIAETSDSVVAASAEVKSVEGVEMSVANVETSLLESGSAVSPLQETVVKAYRDLDENRNEQVEAKSEGLSSPTKGTSVISSVSSSTDDPHGTSLSSTSGPQKNASEAGASVSSGSAGACATEETKVAPDACSECAGDESNCTPPASERELETKDHEFDETTIKDESPSAEAETHQGEITPHNDVPLRVKPSAIHEGASVEGASVGSSSVEKGVSVEVLEADRDDTESGQLPQNVQSEVGSQDSGINVTEDKALDKQMADVDVRTAASVDSAPLVRILPSPIQNPRLRQSQPVHELVSRFEGQPRSCSSSSSTDTLEAIPSDPAAGSGSGVIGRFERSLKPTSDAAARSMSVSDSDYTLKTSSLTRHQDDRKLLRLSMDGTLGLKTTRQQKEIPKKGTVSKAKAVFQNNPDMVTHARTCGTDFNKRSAGDGSTL